MAVVRRNGSPVYWVEFQFKGKRYRQSAKTTHKDKAREFEHRLRRQIHDELVLGHVQYVPMRFGEAVKRYRTTHLDVQARLKKTADSHAYVLGRLVKLVGEQTQLHQITTPVIAQLKERLLDDGSAAATVNRYLADLRAILRMAHLEWGTLPQVPRIKLLRLDNQRTRWLREDEEVRLLKACEAMPHLCNLIVFLLDTGARLGEACRLCWVDVELPKRGRGSVRFMITKSRKPRSVPLPKRCDQLLRGLYAVRPLDQDRVLLIHTVGCAWRRTQPQVKPFENPHGAWKTAVRRADVHDLRIHDLRHTYASRLVQRGVPLVTVSQLLGHASLAMTLRYSHLATEDLRAAVAKLD